MKRILIILVLSIAATVIVTPASAADQISYTSQPDEVAVFLNNVAFARDSISLPGGVDVAVVLPSQIFQDTLVVRENGERVSTYRINRSTGQIILRWQSSTDSASREVTLEYLLSGVSWMPKYDMWLGNYPNDTDGDKELVDFTFFAEITNSVLSLDDVDVRLVAGRVDTSHQMDSVSTVTANQYIAGYDRGGAGMMAEAATVTGQVSIQHIYDVPNISADMGDVVYIKLQESTLQARRVHLWNASTDNQITVIYKVLNESALPLAEGIVRSYQNGLFIGSDFVELTPIGGEGSVTIGSLQEVRVSRSETRTAISSGTRWDTEHDIAMEMTNFGSEPVDIVIVDYYPEYSIEFSFSHEPELQGNNLFRWEITLDAGETLPMSYRYVAYN